MQANTLRTVPHLKAESMFMAWHAITSPGQRSALYMSSTKTSASSKCSLSRSTPLPCTELSQMAVASLSAPQLQSSAGHGTRSGTSSTASG